MKAAGSPIRQRSSMAKAEADAWKSDTRAAVVWSMKSFPLPQSRFHTAPVKASTLAPRASRLLIWAGGAPGAVWRISATTPETCGAAMLVPAITT